jgi:hypothetical protein
MSEDCVFIARKDSYYLSIYPIYPQKETGSK